MKLFDKFFPLSKFAILTNIFGFLSIADVSADKVNHPCHPELVSGSYQRGVKSLIRHHINKMLKQVQHDSCLLNDVNKSRRVQFIAPMKSFAFSLVELLMALLVASLLMAALAPVMTKRITENIHVDGNMNPPTANVKKIEIDYNSNSPENNFKCTEIKTDTDGSEYCEGEFTVPNDYNGIMKITVIGAGGGGGTAPTAGYTEYTTVSNTHQFTVPAMVNKAEVTLVSGGAGGGAGGQITKTQTFVTYGNGNITADSNNKVTVESSGKGTWTIPEAVRGKYLLATACGGGGGGGSSNNASSTDAYYESKQQGYGGGSGGYIKDRAITFANADELTYYIGGGGDGGGHDRYNSYPISGSNYYTVLPYGGGISHHNAWSYDPTCGASGELLTSTNKGGAGGKGLELKDITVTVAGNKKSFTTHGGDGGSPNGGNANILHWMNCYDGSAGGGGAASQILIGSGIYLNAPGGGGGSSQQRVVGVGACPANNVAGGGGGGGTGGGAGGGLNSNNGKGGTNGTNGNDATGGIVSTIFGTNYCNGGNGGVYVGNNSGSGSQGKSGAIRFTYLDYGPGASGGGAGQIVPIQQIAVTQNETLNIKVGSGGTGGTKGEINSAGAKTEPATGQSSSTNITPMVTKISRGATDIISTPANLLYGLYGGSPTGQAYPKKGNSDFYHSAMAGHITNGSINSTEPVSYAGFTNTYGRTAGNKSETGNITYAPGTIGGDGGALSIFNGEIKCEGGKGGTKASPDGKSPVSGYGCGGGGGYSFGNGGKGAGGYARISWNKYWDTATSAYKNANIGAGGGGASGNVLTYTISVISGQKIRVRIGKGGKGATVLNNTLINATKGGDTIFGDSAFGEIKAGGGYGGISPSVNTTTNELINGTGGNISNICHYKSTSLLNKSSCKKGIKGFNAENATGGKGADLPNYGTGGKGGIPGDNSDGTKALDTGYGAGGGGAALRDLGRVDSSTQTNITRNENKGGDGSNGRIIIEWWE